ncbi:MAG TPA: CBS domain-containing protein [Bryobacteraceae bacterium]|nr:CBS domain-containing protein [Bryobacteraceae bacterium]
MTLSDTITSILDKKNGGIWSISPDASVYDAIAMMADRRVGALLVMSGGELVGIISERDYARKVVLAGKSSKDTPVEAIMTRDVLAVTPEHTVEDCMMIITENRIRHLPVLRGRQVIGVISIGDLVRSIISAQADTIDHLHTYIHGAAMVK